MARKTRSRPFAAAAWRAGAIVLALAAETCAADPPQSVTRLVPLGPKHVAPTPLPPALVDAWQLSSTELAEPGRWLHLRLDTVRRPARLATVPARFVATVPAGVGTLRFWRTPARALVPSPGCRVHWTTSWSAGARVLRSDDVERATRRDAWIEVTLTARPAPAPTALAIEATAEPACRASSPLAGVSQVQALTAAPVTRPNLVLVVIDALRRDRLDCAAATTALSPRAIAPLCRRGVFFDDAFSTSSWTYPAVASLLTGLLPREHQALRRGAQPTDLAPQVLTAAEALAGAGYDTAAWVPNPYAARGLWRGFDSFDELFPGPGRLTSEIRRADNVVDRAIAWLRQRPGRPFFLFLLFIDAHDPVDAATKLGPPLPECAGIAALPFGWEGIARPALPPTAEQERRMRCRRALYDASLTFIDGHLARLVDALTELGLAEQTALVVTSDHGEELWDHAAEQHPGPGEVLERWGVDHGHTLYVELAQVPLLLVPPLGSPLPPRSHRSDLVSLRDLFPTLLSLAHVPAPPRPGTSDLSWALTSELPLGHDVPSENTLYGPQRVSLTTPAWRAILTAPDHFELFDRQRDPTERSPLPPDHPLQTEARRRLDLWREVSPAQ